MKRRARIGAGVVLAAGCAATLALAGPRPVGPSTFVVVARGDSMQPRFHVGDLVAVRAARSYGVGDIIAFHTDYNRVVLHRIIGVEGTGFVTRGDHNTFTDPFRPSRGDVIGALWWSVPKAGLVVSSLRKPAVAGVVGAGLLLVGSVGVARRRRRRQPDADDEVILEGDDPTLREERAGPPSPRVLMRISAIPAVIACVAGGLSGLAWAREVRAPQTIPTVIQGAFSYRAPTPANSIYGIRGATTGQPIFFKSSNRLGTAYQVRFSSPAAHAVNGDLRITTTLSAANGWTARVQSTDRVPFSADTGVVRDVIDLDVIQRTIRALEATAGVANGPYKLDVQAEARVRGTVAARPYEGRLTSQYRLRVDQFQLQIDRTDLAQGVSPFESSADGAVSVPDAIPAHMKLLRWTAGVRQVRQVATPIAAGAGALAVALLLLAAPWRPRDEVERILDTHGRAIVRVRSVRARSVLEVDSFDALRRVAEHGELMILFERSASAFYVKDGATLYRYTPGVSPRFAYEPPRLGRAQLIALHEDLRESDAS